MSLGGEYTQPVKPVKPSQELISSVRAIALQKVMEGNPTYTFRSIFIKRHDVDTFLYDEASNTYYHLSLSDARKKGLLRRGIVVSEPKGEPVTADSKTDLWVSQYIPKVGNNKATSASNEELDLLFRGSSGNVEVKTWHRGDNDVTTEELSQMQENIRRAKKIRIRRLPRQVYTSIFSD